MVEDNMCNGFLYVSENPDAIWAFNNKVESLYSRRLVGDFNKTFEYKREVIKLTLSFLKDFGSMLTYPFTHDVQSMINHTEFILDVGRLINGKDTKLSMTSWNTLLYNDSFDERIRVTRLQSTEFDELNIKYLVSKPKELVRLWCQQENSIDDMIVVLKTMVG